MTFLYSGLRRHNVSSQREAARMKDSLFETDSGWHARELVAADVPALQALFEARQDYFRLVSGQDVAVDEAAREFADLPPAEMPYRRMCIIGFFDAAESIWGMASIVTDFIARGVGHIGLFLMRDGGGAFSYAALEKWMHEVEGQQWLRLGVVIGNERAERFWERCGYLQLRERGPVEYGVQTNMLRVMMKPLAGGTWSEYLALVERDRPEASPI
ncbi:hypothetical protein ASC95_17880 [Pelomonas sp. Root1217]|uniref:hypothetical protein n=1 Tax=Pelomonas sp. Root1217 TaxID=1736430 RepID=UPI00070AC42A|nr:hypothetical protein [Pelomonas sp. Root1217]KQV49465.1 hypothetical protein ASC95_17880 [Pelomonas sp. Root1217]